MNILYKIYDYLKEDDARMDRIFIRVNIALGLCFLSIVGIGAYAYVTGQLGMAR